ATRAAPLPGRRAPATLRAHGLTKRYGTTIALDGIDLGLEPGRVHALTGRNGSGKTTLLRALAGTLALDAGRVELDGAGVKVGIARTLQSPGVFAGLSVLESALVGATARARCSGLA